MTATGSDSSTPVGILANGSSIFCLRPGRTVTPPTVIFSLRLGSATHVLFDVLDDQPGDVDVAGPFDALEAR